jgi:hypothetical protein
VHGCTGGATGAGFGLLYFDWRTCALWPWQSATVAEAHAGIAFATPDFRYNKRQRQKAVDPPDARTFTMRLVNALLRAAQVVIALSLTPTRVAAPVLCSRIISIGR